LILPAPPADAPAMPDAAFSLIAPLYAACYAIWDDAADDAANRDWLAATMRALEPFGVGHYLGEADLDADASRARRSFTEPNWQRLQALRREYDPHGLFHTFP
jgi:FAD/FMN-containing dehydrogenase